MSNTIGERIKIMRQSRNMSQVELAERINLKRSTIGMYERGEREPDLDTIEALADVFNVPMSALIDRKNQPDTMTELEQQELIQLFASLPEDAKHRFLDLMRTVAEAHISK